MTFDWPADEYYFLLSKQSFFLTFACWLFGPKPLPFTLITVVLLSTWPIAANLSKILIKISLCIRKCHLCNTDQCSSWIILTHWPLGDLNKILDKQFSNLFQWLKGELSLVKFALNWMSLDLTEDKSTLVQVMAWCRQAASHYLSQYWPRSVSPYGVIKPQWVNFKHFGNMFLSYALQSSIN